MQEIARNKYFYYISFMLVASTFLPLVFNNLPPYIRSHHLWTIVWIVSLILFYPNIFFNKGLAYVLVYGILLLLATETIWKSIDGWNYRRLFYEFYEITIGISVILYFFKSGDYIGLAKITRWTLIFMFITAIMTIFSSAIDPMYARDLTGLGSITDESERATVLGYKHYGGGTYSTAAAFMCLFPILIYNYKENSLSLLSKAQIIILSLSIFLALLGMQIFGNIIVAIIFGMIALMGMKKIRQSILILIILFSVFALIPQRVYVRSLISISQSMKNYPDINYKFRDMATFIETGSDINSQETEAGRRVARYPVLLKTFVKSPVAGCYYFSDKSGNGYQGEGGHLYWMNKLTITGIIGLLIFMFIPFNFIKSNLRQFDSNYKFYYLLASLSLISYGLIKNIGGRETWYTFFIILPGLYYLPLLNREKK
jgi:hypothetical protein